MATIYNFVDIKKLSDLVIKFGYYDSLENKALAAYKHMDDQGFFPTIISKTTGKQTVYLVFDIRRPPAEIPEDMKKKCQLKSTQLDIK